MAEKYEKLKRMRADIEKSRTRIEKLNEDLEHKLENLRKAEAEQMLEDIYELGLTPEMLGEYLDKYKGNIKVPVMAETRAQMIKEAIKENKEDEKQNIM